MTKSNFILIAIVSLIALGARFIPHIPNFSPLASAALFAGVYGRDKKLLFLPLIALFISDIFIGFYEIGVMASVYLSMLLTGFIGIFIKKYKNTLNLLSGSLASALLFFLMTNVAVWYFGSWYSHDLAGLALCLNLAIPFFKSTLASNLLYSGLLFGVYEASLQLTKNKKLLNNQ
ncbi:hypothetical protein KKH39_01375 [Patescibacteria group bacterium]|nr:hypothetical protein [Patescibacteria group bacterium]